LGDLEGLSVSYFGDSKAILFPSESDISAIYPTFSDICLFGNNILPPELSTLLSSIDRSPEPAVK
jgi:hypothetical protein